MDNNLIKVNLLPGYKEDKFISNTIYRITFAVIFLFVIYYFMFLPIRNANQRLKIAEFEKSQLNYTQTYYSARLSERLANPRDVVYSETIEFVENLEVPLNTWISQLNSVNVPGFEIETYEFNLDAGSLLLEIVYESDQALLEFEELIWSFYWVETYVYESAGPGAQDVEITYKVGDSDEE
jgi:hypothetical protein